jgi:hypothetical protein
MPAPTIQKNQRKINPAISVAKIPKVRVFETLVNSEYSEGKIVRVF